MMTSKEYTREQTECSHVATDMFRTILLMLLRGKGLISKAKRYSKLLCSGLQANCKISHSDSEVHSRDCNTVYALREEMKNFIHSKDRVKREFESDRERETGRERD